MTGSLRVTSAVPIILHGTVYELHREANGLITGLRATVSVPDKGQWPILNQGPPHTLSNVIPPAFAFIQLQLRAVRGALSFFGVNNIDLNPSVEWKAEREEEKKALRVYSFSSGKADSIEAPPIPFDLVARTFLASENLYDLEKALNFYRNGVLDLAQERYIEAIHDFYYVIEVLFANGKSGKGPVIREFSKSQSLKHALNQAAQELETQYTIPNWKQRVVAFFDKPHKEIYAQLFDIRGSLHHAKNHGPNAWHPDHQKPYHFEAIIFANIAYNATFPNLMKEVSRKEVIDAYKNLFKQTNNSPSNG